MQMPDPIDLAGMTYLITEYDELAGILDDLPEHSDRAAHCREKRDNLARHWAHFVLGVDTVPEGDPVPSWVIEQAREYRSQHSGHTLAYLTRSGHI